MVLALVGLTAGTGLLQSDEYCEGYDNCVSKLLSVIQNQYKGYTNSISAVHHFQTEYNASPVQSSSTESSSTGGGDSGSSGSSSSEEEADDTVLQGEQGVTADDGTFLGVLGDDAESVVDEDGNVVGTFQGGVFTPVDGGAPYACRYDTGDYQCRWRDC